MQDWFLNVLSVHLWCLVELFACWQGKLDVAREE